MKTSRMVAAAALCLALLGLASGPPAAAAGESEYWEQLTRLRQALAGAGYDINHIGEIPDEPLDGPVLVAEERPTAAMLRGLWDYVARGGAVVLPIEVPVNLDDPLVRTVNSGGGRKIVDSDQCYRQDPCLPLVEFSLAGPGRGRPLTLVLNMPTFLSDLDIDIEGTAVMGIPYGPQAHVAHQGPTEEPLTFAWLVTCQVASHSTSSDIDQASPDGARNFGRALIVADYSLLTNQMIVLGDNRRFILEALKFVAGRAPSRGAPLYWLGPGSEGEPEETGQVPPGGGADAAGGWSGLGPFWWTELFALPLAVIPLNVYNRRRWLPFHNDSSTESRFRSLVRLTAASADYAMPCRHLAVEMRKVLGRVLQAEVPERLAAAAPACAEVYAARHPETGRFRVWLFKRRCAGRLARLEALARRETRVSASELVKVYEMCQDLLKEIGGTRYYGQGTFRGNSRWG